MTRFTLAICFVASVCLWAAEPVAQAPKNLLANPDFSLGSGAQPEGWHINPDFISAKKVFRQQKAPGSTEWVLVAVPGTYALCQQAVAMTPGQKYTIKVIARYRSQDTALGVCQYDQAGNVVYILWQEPLTEKFKSYVKTFTAAPKMKAIILYNLAPPGESGPGTGTVDIADVFLYEGEVAP